MTFLRSHSWLGTEPKLELRLLEPNLALFVTAPSSIAGSLTHMDNPIYPGKERELQRSQYNYPMVLGHFDSIVLSQEQCFPHWVMSLTSGTLKFKNLTFQNKQRGDYSH